MSRKFPNLWIDRCGCVTWPPRPPDLMLLKGDGLDGRCIASIIDAITHIKEHRDTIREATLHILNRVEKCIKVDEGISENHLHHIFCCIASPEFSGQLCTFIPLWLFWWCKIIVCLYQFGIGPMFVLTPPPHPLR